MSRWLASRPGNRARALRVLVIQAHPRTDSLCAALAAAYVEGACSAGAEINQLSLPELTFDPNMHQPSPKQQPLEPDLARARDLIADSDHLVFVYPTWWGTMPALLKGFLDRLLWSGWAFRFHDDERHWDKLLAGRTAELITTMDTPPWAQRLVNRRPGHNAMRRATLGFCGIRNVRETVCGPVSLSTHIQRKRWLQQARARGQSLATGPFTRRQRLGNRLAAWCKSLRLQFYPMTWTAYTIGALMAPDWAGMRYGLGYALLFLLEAATVWSNEVQDYESDRRNQAFGPFTGGSRVLVDGSLSRARLNRATVGALLLAGVGAVILLGGAAAPIQTAAVLAVLTVLALGYSLPLLRLLHRGLGEIDVAVTHSIAVLLLGLSIQGGDWIAPQPWLVSLPLFWSVFGAITLAGIPDRTADDQAGKRTLAVRFGPRRALQLATITTILAPLSMLFLTSWYGMPGYGYVMGGILLHAIFLLRGLRRHAHREVAAERIDGLLFVALSFILWFCVPQLLWLYL